MATTNDTRQYKNLRHLRLSPYITQFVHLDKVFEHFLTTFYIIFIISRVNMFKNEILKRWIMLS